jgi:hypothetical protein
MKMDLRLALLSVVVIGGIVTWAMLPGPSDAEGQPVSAPPPVLMAAQNTSMLDPGIASPTAAPPGPVQETLPAATAPAAAAPIDGLSISSQSFRRGGLGSKALVTFTLRNRNDYAVRDIEIACAFLRPDGSHLTDRRRTIHDIVNMKSRKTFDRMLVGFINISANRARCSLVTATRV